MAPCCWTREHVFGKTVSSEGWAGSPPPHPPAELRRQHRVLKVTENILRWVGNDKICALKGKLERLV